MAFSERSLDDYVDVAQRIADFREQHPNGSLQPVNPEKPWELAIITGTKKDGQETTQTFIVYTAAAYRDPLDARPGIGVAWEIWPGRTPYTLGSELMNAETSAWGRAIVAALASDSKNGVASRQEVRARREDGLPTNQDGSLSRSRTTDEEKAAAGVMTKAQQAEHTALQPKAAEVRGKVTRATSPALDDPWATAVPADATEPGSIRAGQQRAMHAACKGMDRDQRLATISDIIGRAVTSSNELSYTEAARVLGKLTAP